VVQAPSGKRVVLVLVPGQVSDDRSQMLGGAGICDHLDTAGAGSRRCTGGVHHL